MVRNAQRQKLGRILYSSCFTLRRTKSTFVLQDICLATPFCLLHAKPFLVHYIQAQLMGYEILHLGGRRIRRHGLARKGIDGAKLNLLSALPLPSFRPSGPLQTFLTYPFLRLLLLREFSLLPPLLFRQIRLVSWPGWTTSQQERTSNVAYFIFGPAISRHPRHGWKNAKSVSQKSASRCPMRPGIARCS